jgi:hypothetical protein
MLYMAQAHVADNPFHADCLKVMEKIRSAPDQTLAHSILLKRMKMDAQTFQKMIFTLTQQGDLEVIQTKTTGRTGTHYKAIGEGRGNKGE